MIPSLLAPYFSSCLCILHVMIVIMNVDIMNKQFNCPLKIVDKIFRDGSIQFHLNESETKARKCKSNKLIKDKTVSW